jgi:hypothetical protein
MIYGAKPYEASGAHAGWRRSDPSRGRRPVDGPEDMAIGAALMASWWVEE